MEQVCIPVPMPTDGEALELEVTVGGTRHLMQYRIETLNWGPDDAPAARFDQLQAFIRDYDPAWSLVQIGAPGEGVVPITFRQRRTETAPDSAPDPTPEADPEAGGPEASPPAPGR